jgi:hypothetical protein
MSSPPPRLVLYASWRGLAAAVTTPVVLIALGAAGLAGGSAPVAATLAIVGTVLGTIVLFDYPRRCVFDTEGVERVCFLRRQRLSWKRLVAIERARPSTVAQARNLRPFGHAGEPVVSGGLVARGPGRRRWLLTDRVESRQEYDRLAGHLDSEQTPTVLRAPRPHAEAPPTDLYRRSSRPS